MNDRKAGAPRFRVIDGGVLTSPPWRRWLLAQGAFMKRFHQGALLVHGRLTIQTADSLEAFLRLMEQSEYDGLLIDAAWGGSAEDALQLLRTVRAIEANGGRKPKPVIICTTTVAGWRTDALDKNVWVYEFDSKLHPHEVLPRAFLDFVRNCGPSI